MDILSQGQFSTVVSNYIKSIDNDGAYESESELENKFILTLQNLGYEYASDIKNEFDLKRNLKDKIEALNDCKFSDGEFSEIYKYLMELDSNQKAELIHRGHSHHDFNFEHKNNVYFLNKENINKNSLQIINQFRTDKNRYDVNILVNGIPLIHIELKRRGVSMKEAFNQIKRYNKNSFENLFEFITIFVISNGTFTRYYSNDKNSFELTSVWSDEKNNHINDLMDFGRHFFHKSTILNILFKYCVLDSSNKLFVMRPYQIAAVEKAMNKINICMLNKLCGSNSAKGYIWHSTGSGKTLTSFKLAHLSANIDEIKKVLFVVDRKDLDAQTIQEYEKFGGNGCVAGNENIKKLASQIESSVIKIIVTTIQKLSIFIKQEKNTSFIEPCVIIFDECHRSQFGKMNARIQQYFKKRILLGFTGTPIFNENAPKNNIEENFYTTERVFGECLHRYTLQNAIKDKNVLPFKVDYFKNLNENEFLNEKRIQAIAKKTMEIFDIKTQNRNFNALFAASSIEAAKKYYNEFKKSSLKTAIIYSASNENEESSENIDSADGLNQSDREFLASAMMEFNENSSLEKFSDYYKGISKAMKDKDRDLLIVVNMFLTGFDAKRLNSIFIDKNLRYHSLLQSFSRTNRIYDESKKFGNVVCFCDLESATNEAILLFNDGRNDIVILKNFAAYFEGKDGIRRGFLEINNDLKNINIGEIDDEKGFVTLYNEFLDMKNIIDSFCDEDSLNILKKHESKILSQREIQDLQSAYLEISEKYQKAREEGNFSDEMEFRIELIKSVEIDDEFIKKLRGCDEINDLERLVKSNPKYRKSWEVFKDYFESYNKFDMQDFIKFAKKRAKDEFENLAELFIDKNEARDWLNTKFKSREIDFRGETHFKGDLFVSDIDKEREVEEFFYRYKEFGIQL